MKELVKSLCTEIFATLVDVVEALGDVCSMLAELTNDFEVSGCMCCRGSRSQLVSLIKRGMVGLFTRMNCQIVYCTTAGKLHMAVTDVAYLMSQRQENTDTNQSEDVGQITKQVTEQVQQDLK